MTDLLSPKGQTFLLAWKAWDIAASRITEMVRVELKNDRVRRPSEYQLKAETDLMVDTLADFAKELNLNPVHMMRVIQELRRDGVDYEKALNEVILYLRSE